MATGFDFNAHTGAREKSLGPCEAEFGAETLHTWEPKRAASSEERLEKLNLSANGNYKEACSDMVLP